MPMRVQLTTQQHLTLEVALAVQDPCGERAIELAREVLRLIHDRDDVTCLALASEMRALGEKYPHAHSENHHQSVAGSS